MPQRSFILFLPPVSFSDFFASSRTRRATGRACLLGPRNTRKEEVAPGGKAGEKGQKQPTRNEETSWQRLQHPCTKLNLSYLWQGPF